MCWENFADIFLSGGLPSSLLQDLRTDRHRLRVQCVPCYLFRVRALDSQSIEISARTWYRLRIKCLPDIPSTIRSVCSRAKRSAWKHVPANVMVLVCDSCPAIYSESLPLCNATWMKVWARRQNWRSVRVFLDFCTRCMPLTHAMHKIFFVCKQSWRCMRVSPAKRAVLVFVYASKYMNMRNRRYVRHINERWKMFHMKRNDSYCSVFCMPPVYGACP